MARGQKRLHLEQIDRQTTPSSVMQGDFISIISPVFSLMILSTRCQTRWTPPQYAAISSSNQRPRFMLDLFSVFRIAAFDLILTVSLGCR